MSAYQEYPAQAQEQHTPPPALVVAPTCNNDFGQSVKVESSIPNVLPGFYPERRESTPINPLPEDPLQDTVEKLRQMVENKDQSLKGEDLELANVKRKMEYHKKKHYDLTDKVRELDKKWKKEQKVSGRLRQEVKDMRGGRVQKVREGKTTALKAMRRGW